jgi:hypothetical protein
MKRFFLAVLFSLAVTAFADELPLAAQKVVNDYVKQRAAGLGKLNSDLLFKLRPLQGTLERSGDANGAAAVQTKIDELEAEMRTLAEAKAAAEKEPVTPPRTGTFTVIVYSEENFKGDSVRLRVPFEISGPQDREEHDIVNDSISSIKVPEGVEVILYDGELSGRSIQVTEDMASLGSLRGSVTSLAARIVEPK